MVGLALSAILVARRGVVLLGGADGNALDAADVAGPVRVGSRQLCSTKTYCNCFPG